MGLLAAIIALLALAMVPAAGCVSGGTCAGGFVTEDGVCEAQCVTEKCKAGNVCVGNRCVLPCVDNGDCVAGTACLEAEGDDGEAIRLCQPIKQRPPFVDPVTGLQPGGYGWPCPFGDGDCQCPFGADNCAVQALACPNGLECDPLACADCAQDAAVCQGDPNCNVGKCGDGSACTFNTCDVLTECTPFVCVGAGIGDASAYCTRHDCDSDAACPSGYYCGNTRDPHDICGNTCNGGTCSDDPDVSCTSDGQCQKGNNNTCGLTEEPCLDIAAANAAGQSFFESGVCLMRKTCLVRDECTRCEQSSDCAAGNAEVCGTHADQDVCLRLCDKPSDCRLDEFCVSYVPASGGTGGTCASNVAIDCEVSEDCPTPGDACVPRSVCVPAAGACDASDSPSKFCRHCVDDEDCGGADKPGRWACIEVSSGEYGCFDLSFSVPCKTDQDCPLAPSGRHGECLDTEVASNSSAFERCYFPFCDPADAANPCTEQALAQRYTCN